VKTGTVGKVGETSAVRLRKARKKETSGGKTRQSLSPTQGREANGATKKKVTRQHGQGVTEWRGREAAAKERGGETKLETKKNDLREGVRDRKNRRNGQQSKGAFSLGKGTGAEREGPLPLGARSCLAEAEGGAGKKKGDVTQRLSEP